MPAFVLSPCLLSCLLSVPAFVPAFVCCPPVAGQGTFRPRSDNVPSPVRPSVAGQSTFRRRSGGFPSQVQQRTVPGPHFCPGPATVFGILCILASPVPDKTTDRGHKPFGPGTQAQPTGDANPSDQRQRWWRTRDKGDEGPGTEVPRRPETGWQDRGASTRGHKKTLTGKVRVEGVGTIGFEPMTSSM